MTDLSALVGGLGEIRAAIASSAAGINGSAVGGSSPGTPLLPGLTFIDATSAGGMLQLPAALPGTTVALISGGDNTLTVGILDGSGDTVNGISDIVDWATTTSGSLPRAMLWFVCFDQGAWLTNGVLD